MLKMFWNLMFSSPLPPRPQAHPRLKEARTEKDQLQLLLTLENAMTVLYDFVMKEKERCDELIKRVEVLEKNEKDNPRQPA